MKIKNQNFWIIESEFEFIPLTDFEVEISLEQDCFANCVLVASGQIDVDGGLFPDCKKYFLKTESEKQKIVDIDSVLKNKIEDDISVIFEKKFNDYCDDQKTEMAISRYEDSLYD